jgi:predicted AlkP superfamily phosphohydrolase/phosphomutase
MPTRVLLIALDAADADLIKGWAASGHLPTFKRLEETALRGTVENPYGLFVGALWPSFATGVSPTRHGRYCYTQLVPGTYRTRATNCEGIQGTSFWTSLSRAGRRVAVIDVPKASATSGGFDSALILDWGSHEAEVDGGFRTSPPSLARSVLARYGPDPVGSCDLIHGQPEEYERLRERLLARVALKTRMIRDVVQEGDWDLVVACFADTHCAGHQLWNLHAGVDAGAPDPGESAPFDPMRDVYAAADRALGKLVRGAEEDTVCIVLASHGIGPFRGGNKILDDILRRVDGGGAKAAPERRAMNGLRGIWKRHVPVGVKRALITVRQRSWHRVEGMVLRREYAGRRFFAIPNNDIYGAIRLNLAGREPRGRVQKDEVESVCAELERELRSLTNLDTGGPAVTRVVKASDHYERGPMDNLPDLFVEWSGDLPIVRVRTARGDVVEGFYPDYRTGDHREQGAFWITGPGIAAGALASPVSITDFAPTIGELLGVPLPGLDGRPIPGVAG